MNPVNTKPYNLPDNAIWLITGCSKGIGREIANYIANTANQRLIATARDLFTLSYLPTNANILKLALDVTSPTSVDDAFKAAAAYFGEDYHIDVVVNNAGYSLSGDTESATEEQMHQEIETLFFGTVRVTLNAIKVMRQEKDCRGGLIFNISSLAGICAFPGHAFYHAGKFAVEGWTESVAREMHPDWNINFCLVEPSGVKTNFEGSSKKYMERHLAYTAEDMPSRKLEAFVKQSINSGGGIEPVVIAKSLFNIATRKEKVPLRLPLGAPAFTLIKKKFEEQLQNLEVSKELSMVTQ